MRVPLFSPLILGALSNEAETVSLQYIGKQANSTNRLQAVLNA